LNKQQLLGGSSKNLVPEN